MEKTFSSDYRIPEIELIYKSDVQACQPAQISCSKDAYAILSSSWDYNTIELVEQFKVILLNTGNKVLGLYHLSTGGIKSTVVDLRILFAAALKANASAVILTHNHPSGTLAPSKEDLQITNKITEAGKLLDIKILDHLIITRDAYYSMADTGEI